MNTRQSQLYLAHSAPDGTHRGRDPENGASNMPPEDAADYILALLSSLRVIAERTKLLYLAELIAMAEEEAKLHGRR